MMSRKFLLFAFAFCLCCSARSASASLLTPVSVTGTGSFNNSVGLLTDGFIPAEMTAWTDPANTWWFGQTGPAGVVFEFDYGSEHVIDDLTISADLNDSYQFDYSLDGVNWTSLVTVDASFGDVPAFGMDTMTSIAGDAEYVGGMDFTSVNARFLRAYSIGGDNAYSLGEVQAFGSAVAAVPEPSSRAVFGLISMGWVVRRRRA
ncbi:MAG: PEP-CTERM sorting domain-containing protein [Planctomycetota bacterium]